MVLELLKICWCKYLSEKKNFVFLNLNNANFSGLILIFLVSLWFDMKIVCRKEMIESYLLK